MQTYALVVDDLDNHSKVAGLKLEDATNLDLSPRAGTDLNVCHFVCRLRGSAAELVRVLENGKRETPVRKSSRIALGVCERICHAYL